ncbi:MAG: glycosyltransferase family 4 protein [Saprospiraceae bacterium]|jgi:glycosyltransferase involved in cell wall biosynthesis|nr:glycosyltransferase family 4 protein [Saprospiraceae bacterium]MDP4997420.1 glycosyltransferase family 4 protein [Saprospiraceae bacterium]
MLRIGFDAKRLFHNFTGLGNYSRTLVKNVAEYYPDNPLFLYTPSVKTHPETQFFLSNPQFQVIQPGPREQFLWRSLGIKQQISKNKLDIYHGLSHELPFGIKKLPIKTVVTIHDLVFKKYPEYYGFFDRKMYDFKFRYACEQADQIIAISESTRQDIITYYDIDPDKIEVIYQSCHDSFKQDLSDRTIRQVLQKYQLPENFMLFVGSIIPRKNLLNVVRAMALLPASEQLPLVVVGNGRQYKKTVQEFLQRAGLSDRVFFVQIHFSELPALYQRAALFIYPSFYEGFGIPVIEALYSKTPVISSRVSSMPEAAGPGALLVDPGSREELAAAMQQLLSDEALRARSVEAGYAYVQKFNSEGLTDQLMRLYERLV